jgi:hypothetical protein
LDAASFQVLAGEYIQYSKIIRTMQVVCCRNQDEEKTLWCLLLLVIFCLVASMVLKNKEYIPTLLEYQSRQIVEEEYFGFSELVPNVWITTPNLFKFRIENNNNLFTWGSRRFQAKVFM